MENSVNESEAQQSFRSPPRRRRSTFFENRDSIIPQPVTQNVNSNVCDKLNKMDEKHVEHLQRYYDTLLEEKNQWKAEVNYRRNKYHDLRQQYQMETKAPSGSRISYSVLSDEDIKFLKGKINISQIVESQAKLHKSISQTKELYKRAIELDNVILTHCEGKLNEVTDYLLNNSTVENNELPCNRIE